MKTFFFFLTSFLLTSIFNGNLYAMTKTIMAHDAYVRLLPPSAANTGAFMKLMNHGDKEMKLIKAQSDIAEKVELHNHVMVDGMMKMREVKEIVIKKQQTIELKPGSYHVMLLGLKKPLALDQNVKIKLIFSDNTEILVDAPVKEIQGQKKMKGHQHH